MSGDCGTSKGKIKTHVDEILCKSFVKVNAEDLYRNWYEISKRSESQAKFDDEISPCSYHGDSKVKRLKISTVDKKIIITNLEFVWLQGYVADIAKDFDTFEISDNSCHKIPSHHSVSSSTVFIVNCTKTPGGIASWSKGNYCQGKSKIDYFIHALTKVSSGQLIIYSIQYCNVCFSSGSSTWY